MVVGDVLTVHTVEPDDLGGAVRGAQRGLDLCLRLVGVAVLVHKAAAGGHQGARAVLRDRAALADQTGRYANFYIADDAVFMPEFGDRKADDRARAILQEHFPKRDIVPVVIDTIASGGGGIHCSTHDQPGKPAA